MTTATTRKRKPRTGKPVCRNWQAHYSLLRDKAGNPLSVNDAARMLSIYWRPSWMEFGEGLSLAGVAIVQAARGYDPGGKAAFMTYVVRSFLHECWRVALDASRRKRTPTGAVVSMSANERDDGTGGAYDVPDRRPGPAEEAADRDTKRHAAAVAADMLRHLPARWRTVVEKHHGIVRPAMTLDEIANETGVTRAAVSLTLNDAYRRLRSMFPMMVNH